MYYYVILVTALVKGHYESEIPTVWSLLDSKVDETSGLKAGRKRLKFGTNWSGLTSGFFFSSLSKGRSL